MKIPQDVQKFGRRFEMWRPPKDKQSGKLKGKQPFGYCGQTDTHDQGKNFPAYGKKCMKLNVKSLITSVLCVSPKARTAASQATTKNAITSHQRIQGTNAV